MSGGEQFLSRWARRKRAAAQAPQTAKADSAPARPPASAVAAKPPAASELSEPAVKPDPPFDPATLPPIESITAATDIRPFLVPGVPLELTRAALRRVWTTDPSIRDFVGLADYAWDFNAPDSIAGFGPIEMTAQLRSEISRMVGRNLPGGDGTATEAREAPATAVLSDQSTPDQTSHAGALPDQSALTKSGETASRVPPQRNTVDVAAQNKVEEPERIVSPGQRHGGALPK